MHLIHDTGTYSTAFSGDMPPFAGDAARLVYVSVATSKEEQTRLHAIDTLTTRLSLLRGM